VDLPAAHAALVETLKLLRGSDGGWPYYRGRQSRLEPTCWAMLATGVDAESTPLASWLQPSGLLIEPATGQLNFGFNAVAGLVLRGHQVGSPLVSRIVDGLAGVYGEALAPMTQVRQSHSLRGWPWFPTTFSWVEPTAWSVLLFKHAARGTSIGQARIAEGEAVLRDRACAGGGWNYGNSEVLGQRLAAHVPSTAISVLALQDREHEPFVADAVSFLERNWVTERTGTALALSAFALAAVGRSARLLNSTLVEQAEATSAFGNVATMGLAAHAISCAATSTPSAVFTLRRPPS
jgi:hypothetical protein